jgi:hypothetical protein
VGTTGAQMHKNKPKKFLKKERPIANKLASTTFGLLGLRAFAPAICTPFLYFYTEKWNKHLFYSGYFSFITGL